MVPAAGDCRASQASLLIGEPDREGGEINVKPQDLTLYGCMVVVVIF
jgi:hypothetical protein